MDVLNKISTQISNLASGEKWTISAQELWMSRTDFLSLSVYLSREAEKGEFSLTTPIKNIARTALTSITVMKH